MLRSPDPNDYLTLYLATIRAQGARKVSSDWAAYCIRRFLREAGVATVREINTMAAIRWVDVMQDRGLSPGGIRSYQSAAWTWFRWLHKHRYIREDIPAEVSLMRVTDRKRRTATEDIRAKLIKCARARSEWRARNVALIEVLWSTGIRRGELAQARFENYDSKIGTLALEHTKNGKRRVIGVGVEARLALEHYFVLERDKEDGPLFLARMGRPMSSDAMGCVIRSLAASAGVTVSSHDFRRACAARLRRDGVDLGVVMHQLGHTTPSMTLLYSHLGEEEGALRAFHDHDRKVIPIRRRA